MDFPSATPYLSTDDPLIGFELEGKFICPSTRVTSGNYSHLGVWNEHRPVERVMAPARDGYTLLWNCQLAGMKILLLRLLRSLFGIR